MLFRVFRREDGKWDWHTEFDNGEIGPGTLQGYENRNDCIGGLMKFIGRVSAMDFRLEIEEP